MCTLKLKLDFQCAYRWVLWIKARILNINLREEWLLLLKAIGIFPFFRMKRITLKWRKYFLNMYYSTYVQPLLFNIRSALKETSNGMRRGGALTVCRNAVKGISVSKSIWKKIIMENTWWCYACRISLLFVPSPADIISSFFRVT